MEGLPDTETVSKGCHTSDGQSLPSRKGRKKLTKLKREKKHEMEDGLSSPFEVKDTHRLSRTRKMSKCEQLVNSNSDDVDCDEQTNRGSEWDIRKPVDDTEIADVSQKLKNRMKTGLKETASESAVDEDESDEESELVRWLSISGHHL